MLLFRPFQKRTGEEEDGEGRGGQTEERGGETEERGGETEERGGKVAVFTVSCFQFYRFNVTSISWSPRFHMED